MVNLISLQGNYRFSWVFEGDFRSSYSCRCMSQLNSECNRNNLTNSDRWRGISVILKNKYWVIAQSMSDFRTTFFSEQKGPHYNLMYYVHFEAYLFLFSSHIWCHGLAIFINLCVMSVNIMADSDCALRTRQCSHWKKWCCSLTYVLSDSLKKLSRVDCLYILSSLCMYHRSLRGRLANL